jgi:hypothetical protein
MLKKVRTAPAAAGHGPRMSDQLGGCISSTHTRIPSRNQQPAKPRQASLAEQLLRDRERHRVAATPEPDAECFGCRKSFVYRRPRGGRNSRFCSDECRIEYDSPGAFGFDPLKVKRWRVIAGGNPGYLAATPMRRVPAHKCADGEYRGGFRIDCRGCGKPFESLGWPYCSKGCKHASRERMANAADMAEAGLEPPTKRKCEECGGSIPRWRKGRQVSKAAKFCGAKCASRARRKARTLTDSPDGVLSPETVIRGPQNGPLLIGPKTLPPILRSLPEWMAAGCPVATPVTASNTPRPPLRHGPLASDAVRQ